jgi:hypothetical protein
MQRNQAEKSPRLPLHDRHTRHSFFAPQHALGLVRVSFDRFHPHKFLQRFRKQRASFAFQPFADLGANSSNHHCQCANRQHPQRCREVAQLLGWPFISFRDIRIVLFRNFVFLQEFLDLGDFSNSWTLLSCCRNFVGARTRSLAGTILLYPRAAISGAFVSQQGVDCFH